MAVNVGKIAERIMKLISGNGLKLTMFDNQTGKTTVDPQEARIFYIEQPNIMVSVDGSNSVVSVDIGEGLSINDENIRNLRTNLKQLARDNQFDFDIRSFGEKIMPKNYQFKVEQNKNKEDQVDDVFESFSPMEGSTRTSRQRLENATLIVKHKKPVNEEIRGSRARNIAAIFIENAEGERFKYPYKHLSGARAMTRHIASGGAPSDMTGSAIVEMSSNLYKLKEFMNVVNKQKLVNEENRDVVLNVKRSMRKIKENIAKIQTSKGYTAFVESLALTEESPEAEVSEDTLNSYVSRFSKTTFDESLKDILPLIHKVNEQELESGRSELEEKVLGIITAKTADGIRENDITFPERTSTLEKIKASQVSEELSEADELRELAKHINVVSENDNYRHSRGTDRAAVISMYLHQVAEAIDAGEELSEKQKMLTSYFKKKKTYSKGVDGHNATESVSLEEKFDKTINESVGSILKNLNDWDI